MFKELEIPAKWLAEIKYSFGGPSGVNRSVDRHLASIGHAPFPQAPGELLVHRHLYGAPLPCRRPARYAPFHDPPATLIAIDSPGKIYLLGLLGFYQACRQGSMRTCPAIIWRDGWLDSIKQHLNAICRTVWRATGFPRATAVAREIHWTASRGDHGDDPHLIA